MIVAGVFRRERGVGEDGRRLHDINDTFSLRRTMYHFEVCTLSVDFVLGRLLTITLTPYREEDMYDFAAIKFFFTRYDIFFVTHVVAWYTT